MCVGVGGGVCRCRSIYVWVWVCVGVGRCIGVSVGVWVWVCVCETDVVLTLLQHGADCNVLNKVLLCMGMCVVSIGIGVGGCRYWCGCGLV